MFSSAKQRNKQALHAMGVDAHRFHPLTSPLARLIAPVHMELFLVRLYEGQRLWRESIDRLEAEYFPLWALQPEFVDPANGRALRWDGLFFQQ